MQDFIRRNEGEAQPLETAADGRDEEWMVYLHLSLCTDHPARRGDLDMNDIRIASRSLVIPFRLFVQDLLHRLRQCLPLPPLHRHPLTCPVEIRSPPLPRNSRRQAR